MPFHFARSVAASVPGDNGNTGGVLPMRQWNTRISRHRNGRTHSGDDLKGYLRPPQGLHLFAASAKDTGVAPFKPDDDSSLSCAADHHGFNPALRNTAAIGLFSDGDELSALTSQSQNLAADQAIVEDDLSPLQTSLPLEGKKTGITRSGPHEIDFAQDRSIHRSSRAPNEIQRGRLHELVEQPLPLLDIRAGSLEFIALRSHNLQGPTILRTDKIF